MSVMLTEKAASEVKKIIVDQQLTPETVLRVGVAGGVCSVPAGAWRKKA